MRGAVIRQPRRGPRGGLGGEADGRAVLIRLDGVPYVTVARVRVRADRRPEPEMCEWVAKLMAVGALRIYSAKRPLSGYTVSGD
jgi:hypothetical protein